MLGPLALKGRSTDAIRAVLAQRKRAGLLAYLASASRSGLHSRDVLLSLFWPALDQTRARHALRNALHFLRRFLGNEILITRGADEVGLDPSVVLCDAVAFEAALHAGEREAALSLYRGEFLAGFFLTRAGPFEHWVESERERLRQRAYTAALELAQHEEATNPTAACHWARRALAFSPYAEAGVRQLLTALDRLGDRTAALEAYEAFARRVRQGLEIDPSPETEALMAAIRSRAAPARAVGTVVSGGVLQERGAAIRPDGRSVAVLPFLNLNPDPETQWFSDGITDDIITQLSRIAGLKVISRTSVMRYRERTDVSLRRIGAELGVATVLEGSVRQIDHRVRVTAQLLDAATDRHLWAETYDRELTDIFAIQSDVALHIAAALETELSPRERTRIERNPTTNLQAYHLYLRGRHCLWRFTAEGIHHALRFFGDALRKDADFALAYVSVALSYIILAFGFGTGAMDPDDAYQHARHAAARAVAINADLGEAHAMSAFLKFVYDFDWSGAEDEFRRAIALYPGNADTYDFYGLLLSALERHDEAIQALRRAQELDPLAPVIASDLASKYLRAGRYTEARAEARRLIALEPDFPMAHSTLAWAHLLEGEWEDGLRALRRAAELSPGNTMFVAQLGQAYALAGRPDEARAILEQLEALSRHRYVSPYHLAYVHTGLGDRERAIELLEQAYREHAGGIYGVKGSFLFASLRSHPRMQRLLRAMNLAS